MICILLFQFTFLLHPRKEIIAPVVLEPLNHNLAADVPIHPLSKVTVVDFDSESYIDDFSFMAAVPTSVYTYNGEQYLSPLFFSTGSESESWLIDDWVEYMSVDDGISSAVAIGDLSETKLQDVREKLGSKIWPRIDGASSSENAAMLAAYEWNSSDVAILALSRDEFPEPTITTGSSEHTLTNEAVQLYTYNFTVTDSNPYNFAFTPPSDSCWIEGYVDWAGSQVFTHTLNTPDDYIVDYSVYRQTVFERNPLYVSELVPLHFWYPMISDGEWTMTITPRTTVTTPIDLSAVVKYHPGFTQAITVPSNAKWLNVSINWDNAGTDLNLALVDPTNRLTQWAPAESLISGAGRDSIDIPYPMGGQWKLIVTWPDASSETNNVDTNWIIESLPQNLDAYMESAANGAVIASLMNAPLLYVSPSSVPTYTEWALEYLDVSNIILIDPAGIHQSSLETQIDSMVTRMNADTYPAVSAIINSLANTLGIMERNLVVTTPLGHGEEFFPVAAFSAAKQAATVLSLSGIDNSVTTRAEETWYPYLIGPDIENVYVTERWTTRTENGWYDERIPNSYSMNAAANTFIDFLDDRGAYDAVNQQMVTILSPTDMIKTSFDRAIQGEFIVGRLPAAHAPLMSIFGCKGALHRFLFSTADSADTSLLSMYAYTDGYNYLDNFGTTHYIQQYDNSLNALEGADFTIESHVGKNEVYSILGSQVAIWSFSTHGTLTIAPTDPPERPGGLGFFSLRSEDAPYGFEESIAIRESPQDSDNLVNPVMYPDENAYHVLGNTEELDSQIENIGSPIVLITACLLGGTNLPYMLMEHGAVAVIAAPRTVYFQPGGLLCDIATESLADGNSTGASLTYGLMAVSSNYVDYVDDTGSDYGNQQVLFGDPSVRLYETTASPHVAAVDPLSTEFGTHTPGRGIPEIAALGSSNDLPIALQELEIDYDFYTSGNYTEFMLLLDLRRILIIYPESDASLLSELESRIDSMKDYVASGGALTFFGVSETLDWLPWSASYQSSGPGSSVTILEPEHPLVTSPNPISESLTYQGTLDSLWSNFSVIASDGSGAVFVAGTYGNGKVALSTINVIGIQEELLLENVAGWIDAPSLYLLDVELSQIIIWGGDRVTITLTVVDQRGIGITGLAPTVYLNSTEFAVTEIGNGLYRFIADETWTSNNAGWIELRVYATRTGYDPLNAVILDLMYIRLTPYLMIVIAVAAIVIIAGASFYIRRRGSGSRSRTKDEYKKQQSEDAKIDAKELFGV